MPLEMQGHGPPPVFDERLKTIMNASGRLAARRLAIRPRDRREEWQRVLTVVHGSLPSSPPPSDFVDEGAVGDPTEVGRRELSLPLILSHDLHDSHQGELNQIVSVPGHGRRANCPHGAGKAFPELGEILVGGHSLFPLESSPDRANLSIPPLRHEIRTR
jgi:hypothetical protein